MKLDLELVNKIFHFDDKDKLNYLENKQDYCPLINLLNQDDNSKDYNGFKPKFIINQIVARHSHNIIETLVNNENINIFLKYSSLLDPIKYISNKYDEEKCFNLPNKNTNTLEKIDLPYNSAYVDAFFSYLSSILLKEHNFLNGINYYGSVIANQTDYKFNIYDDLEYLCQSKEFIKNINKKFKIDESLEETFKLSKPSLNISNENVELNNIIDLNTVEYQPAKKNSFVEISDNNILKIDDISRDKLDSVNDSNSDNESNIEVSSSEDDESVTSEESNEEPIYIYIKNFPVNTIFLEKCEDTLDEIMMNNNINDGEWEAIFMQIIMSLLTYQKTLYLTHNDLHTNNIMYINTEKKYLYYCYNNKSYRIPTFGKIWKIIDFGRAIYEINGIRIASDSFFENEDAYSQYNCEPFLNNKKPVIEPNYSFDLCRLGCSLYDFFIDNSEDEELDDIQKLVIEWCQDDNKKNILYKKNGDERYPDFKLYKMIARVVHNHTPEKQLEKPIFKQFLYNKKKIPKKELIISIDDMIS